MVFLFYFIIYRIPLVMFFFPSHCERVVFFQLCCCPETIKNSSPPIHTAALTSDTHTLFILFCCPKYLLEHQMCFNLQLKTICCRLLWPDRRIHTKLTTYFSFSFFFLLFFRLTLQYTLYFESFKALLGSKGKQKIKENNLFY